MAWQLGNSNRRTTMRWLVVLILGFLRIVFTLKLNTKHHDYAKLWENPKCIGTGADLNEHPNWKFLPVDECGTSILNDRIFAGNMAQPGQFPWLALLQVREKISKMNASTAPAATEEVTFYTATATGTLISQYYVLTCAHCFYSFLFGDRFILYAVKLGSMLNKYGIEVPVEKYYSFKYKLEPPHERNDVGLIQLKWPVEFNGNISPICLPRGDILEHPEKYISEGEYLTTAGRGAVNSAKDAKGKWSNVYGSELMYTDVRINNIKMCQNIFKKQRDTSEICAGERSSHGFCQGDSGASSIMPVSLGGPPRYYVFGIVSTTDICGSAPGHLVNVICYMKWILDHIEK